MFVDHSQALAVQADGNILIGNFTAAGNDFGVARVDPQRHPRRNLRQRRHRRRLRRMTTSTRC